MKNKKIFLPGMILLLIIQLCVALFFCAQKQGLHYDEYYSYYSSNVTYGLHPTDMEWKDTEEIRSEFMALPGEGFNYGMVKLMQSWDVHPPLYYYVLRTVSVLSAGVFSKWQGLSINLLFFVLSWIILALITKELTGNDRKVTAIVCALFGFSPAIFSGITFIRMYMMLTFACLLILYVHIRAITRERLSFVSFYVPVILLSFVGFQIHYYFAVFLFFMAAAVSLYLFFYKGTRKTSFLYAAAVLLGMFLSIVAYPSCVSHIFKGYRGTEAQDAFFDISNIGQRFNFFFDLTNEYAFGGMLVVLVLVIILLGLTWKVKSNATAISRANTINMKKDVPADSVVQNSSGRGTKWSPQKQAIMLILFVTMGYFLVVAKTALLNAEEAIRYEMPIYGLLIMLVVLCLDKQAAVFTTDKNKKWIQGVFLGLMGLTLAGQIYGLMQGKVCFLYPQDKLNVEWAKAQQKEDVVYIYNPANQWMIWDESEELMQYEQIYFVNSMQENVVSDENLSETEHVYVYKMRGEEADAVFEKLVEENGGFGEIRLIRELLYCDLYELER